VAPEPHKILNKDLKNARGRNVSKLWSDIISKKEGPMNKKRVFCMIGLAIISFFFLYSTVFAAEPIKGGTLKVGWVAQSKTLDPHKSIQQPERYILYCVFETLTDVDESFNIIPKLAVSWTNPDKNTFKFNLRKGVKFHDGTEFDAEAVKWNIERILNKEFASPQRGVIEPYIQSVEVIDKYTVTFHLKQPFAPLLSLLAERPGFIVSPTAVKKDGDKKFALNPVGTGPFKFEMWLPQATLNLKRFDDYWDKGKPYLDAIEFQEIPDPMVRQTALRAGTVDIITDITAKEAVELKNEGKFKLVKKWPPARWYALQWQVDKPPFNNKALREAIAYGIDRSVINKNIFYGEGMEAVGPVPPGLWWSDKEFKGYTYNPELAKKKLVEAGYPNGFKYKFTVPNLQFIVQISEMLQAQLEKIGIKMEFEMVNQSEAYSKLMSGQSNWSITNWTQRGDPHGLLYMLFHSKGPANSSKYYNSQVDKLIDDGAVDYNQDKRIPIYKEAVRSITLDAPYVYLVYFADWVAMTNKVQGFKWIPDLMPRFSYLWKEK
jgi:peptide/nickel transport system substrate-binding protein